MNLKYKTVQNVSKHYTSRDVAAVQITMENINGINNCIISCIIEPHVGLLTANK